jgi:hypothetical protein
MNNLEKHHHEEKMKTVNKNKCAVAVPKSPYMCLPLAELLLQLLGLLSRSRAAFTFFLTFKNLTAEMDYTFHFCVNKNKHAYK